MTHGVNFDQRYVDLGFTQAGNATLSVHGSIHARDALPGYYMLFILNSQRVPSAAAWVRLS